MVTGAEIVAPRLSRILTRRGRRPALVALHNRISDGSGAEIASVDIFRVRDGLVVEHWGVVQPVPPSLPHPHGMF